MLGSSECETVGGFSYEDLVKCAKVEIVNPGGTLRVMSRSLGGISTGYVIRVVLSLSLVTVFNFC